MYLYAIFLSDGTEMHAPSKFTVLNGCITYGNVTIFGRLETIDSFEMFVRKVIYWYVTALAEIICAAQNWFNSKMS